MNATPSAGLPEGTPGPERCVACGAERTGPFCPACGEARPRGRLRLGEVLREATEATLSLETGFLRTLKGLVRAPGPMVDAYLRGVRRSYCSPVRFFLWMLVIVVAGYAALQWLAPLDPADPTLGMWPEWWVERMRATPSLRRFTEPEHVRRMLDDAQVLARVTAAIQAPAFAVAAWLVFLDRRRTFAEHLVFALYVIGVFIVLQLLQASLLHVGPWWDWWLAMPLPYLYLTWAVGQFHRLGRGAALLRTLGAGALMFGLTSVAEVSISIWSLTRGGD